MRPIHVDPYTCHIDPITLALAGLAGVAGAGTAAAASAGGGGAPAPTPPPAAPPPQAAPVQSPTGTKKNAGAPATFLSSAAAAPTASGGTKSLLGQ
jgi:hypothetical protein